MLLKTRCCRNGIGESGRIGMRNRLWLLLKKSIWHVPKAAYLTSKVTSSTWNCKIVYWRVRYKIWKGYSFIFRNKKRNISNYFNRISYSSIRATWWPAVSLQKKKGNRDSRLIGNQWLLICSFDYEMFWTERSGREGLFGLVFFSSPNINRTCFSARINVIRSKFDQPYIQMISISGWMYNQEITMTRVMREKFWNPRMKKIDP
jgi:hypothetical protein